MWRDRSGITAGDVFALLNDGVVRTRAEIGRQTGLSRTAVAARVRQLAESGLVVEDAASATTGGRPAGRLRVDRAGGVVLAAAIGASRTQLGVCDLAGVVLAETGLDLSTGLGPQAVLPTVAEGLTALSEKVDRRVRGLGLCLPGPVDVAGGTVVESPLLPGWAGVPISLGFPGVPVLVDNDVNALTLAEHSVRPNVADLLHVKVSTGIGAGIVAGGVLHRGVHGAAGEIGHNPVADGGGVVCRCGNLDCLEAVASGAALVTALRAKGHDVADVPGVVALVRAGDPDAVAMVRHAGRRIGEVLAVAVNLLNPQVVVFGGDLAEAFEPLLAGVREQVYRRAIVPVTRELSIEQSALGQGAGIAGCAAMALAEVLSPRAIDAALAPP
ncbi:MAG: ROK family transcriptional regulator [Pseudonocardia sp.]|nr:ROK family transcriptional regulator [Pseudonocardia sp.]